MKRALVTYYTRTGYSRRVAEAIAEALRADTEEIRDARRPARIGVFRALLDAWGAHAATIETPRRMPVAYDLVVVCGPVWSGRMCGAVRGYLRRFESVLPDVAFVATTARAGANGALAEMRASVPRAPVAELAITEHEIECNGWSSGLPRFIDSLREFCRKPAAPPAAHELAWTAGAGASGAGDVSRRPT